MYTDFMINYLFTLVQILKNIKDKINKQNWNFLNYEVLAKQSFAPCESSVVSERGLMRGCIYIVPA